MCNTLLFNKKICIIPWDLLVAQLQWSLAPSTSDKNMQIKGTMDAKEEKSTKDLWINQRLYNMHNKWEEIIMNKVLHFQASA